MAISFVGSAEGSSSPSASTTVTLPGGMAQGDLVIVAQAIGDNDSAALDLLNESSGWTELFTDIDNTGVTQDSYLGVWYKFMGVTPDSSVQLDGLGGTDAASAAVAMVFRGVDQTTPFDVTTTTGTGTGSFSPDPPSIDHNNPSGVWTVIAGASGHLVGGTGTYTFPTGYTTNAIDRGHDDTSDVTVGMAYNSSPADPENPGVMTHSGTNGSTYSWIAATMALRPATFTPKVIHYRFYNDDGDEANSTAITTEDTSTGITAQYGSTKKAHLRVALQETIGVNGATTDDWKLQYNKNAAGWNDVTTTSSNVRAYDSTNLTDGSATTNRASNGLTNGTGSFVAGEQNEDGTLDDHQLTGANYTEHVYTAEFVGNDLANSDSITFRLLYNDATFTHDVTPTATITQTNPTVSSASMADADRNWTTPYQDIAITFSESVDITPAPGVGDTVAGLTAQVNGGGNSALTYVSGNASSSWKVRRAELIQQDDTVVLDYSMASGIVLAVDDEAEVRETTDQAVTNNLTKRVRFTLKDKNNNNVASETIKFAVHTYDSGTVANANWMTREQKSTPTTDGSGVVDVEYTGSSAVGATVYSLVIRPNTTPTESMIWTDTVQ